MAKDILGYEMGPSTPAAAYNAMSVKAAGDARKFATDVVRPAMQQAFPGVAAVAQGVKEDMAGKSLPRQAGMAVRAAPVAAVGVGADVLRSVGLASKAVFGPYMAAATEFGRGLGGSTADAAPTTVAPVVKPVAPVAAAPTPVRPVTTSTPGAGLPSAAQIASDKARATTAQSISDTAMGIAPAAQPANINVSRQANGNLSFSGTGGGTGVTYSGMPNWTSTKGGAGQGSVGGGFNLAEQNARMAAALQGFRDFDRQKQFDESIQNVVSGKGGPVGVAQNKIALANLGDVVQRQMANENATSVATINANTQKRAQDLGLKGALARVGASIYGVDVGAATADKGFEVEKQKASAAIAAAEAKARTGKAMTAKDQTALFVFAGLNADGTPRTPAQQAEVERRYASSFGNRDSLSSLMSAYQVEP